MDATRRATTERRIISRFVARTQFVGQLSRQPSGRNVQSVALSSIETSLKGLTVAVLSPTYSAGRE